MQKIFTVTARRIGVNKRQPHGFAVRKSRDRTDFGNNRRDRVAHGFFVRRIHNFRRITNQRINNRRQNRHRLSVGRKSVKMVQQPFMQQFIVRQTRTESFHFRHCRQTPVNQQPGRFDKRHFFGDRFDRNTAVTQDPFFPVDICDFTDAGRRIAKSRIQRCQTRLGPQFGNIYAPFPRR